MLESSITNEDVVKQKVHRKSREVAESIGYDLCTLREMTIGELH